MWHKRDDCQTVGDSEVFEDISNHNGISGIGMRLYVMSWVMTSKMKHFVMEFGLI